MAKQKRADSAEDKDRNPAPEAAPEGYTVLARRYRPQSFADVVGQEPVARALANAIKANRVAHAYLFTGARGVGKTSTARILARALNCEQGPTPGPCGTCAICQSIAAGDDVDVLEIDGASNRRIDEVRDIRANVQYRPSRARYKIYIIDEVHMLTKEAFNALLKTLEEPPPHVKFIFATTEVEKVPITILSRCQRFDFAGISLPRIVERLRSIVESEGLKADEDALELVARRAGGSMRDAQSLLDQLLAFGGERLTADAVHHLLGTAGDDRVAGLAAAALDKDAKKALELLDEACLGGLQLGELVDQLIAYWRDLMVVQCAGAEGRDLSVPSRHRPELERQAKALTLDTVLAGLEILNATRGRLRGSNHARTLVEMALVRLGRLDDLVSLAQMAQWVSHRPADAAPTLASRASRPAPVSAPSSVAPPEGVKKKAPSDGPDGAAEALTAVWAQVLNNVGGILAKNLEKGGAPAISGPNSLVLRFPATYNHSREHCQDSACVAQVEAALRNITGRPWTFRVEALSAAAAPLTPLGAPAEEAPTRPRRNPREEAEKLPLIQRAREVLGATVQRVDEGFGEAPEAPAGRPAPQQE
jgi:DNA polymerase-3 subunit gamma/tau